MMGGHVTGWSLVDVISERLGSSYIYPERAAQAAALLHTNLAAGRYDLPIGPDLCARLSEDLFAACADKHLRLIWHESAETSQDEQALVAELRALFQRENYGIR